MFLKYPDAVLYYSLDWAASLIDGSTIMSSVWRVEPMTAGAVHVAAEGIDPTGTTARLSGGVAGTVYRVGNLVTLSDGTTDERTLVIRVGER